MGNYNTGIGNGVGYFNSGGSNNTYLGFQAGRGTQLHNKSGSVFLGYKAGYNETSNNKLYIENSEADSTNALIYGDFMNEKIIFNAMVGIGTMNPSSRLDVTGEITAAGGNSNQWNNAYSWGDHSKAFYLKVESDPTIIVPFEENKVPKWELGNLVHGTIYDNGFIGIGTIFPLSQLDIDGSTGYNQLRIRTSYTPTGTSDSNGSSGDISWDNDYIYIKTGTGWKRASLSTF